MELVQEKVNNHVGGRQYAGALWDAGQRELSGINRGDSLGLGEMKADM